MRNEILILFLALLAGGALGVVFFTGLWWTVRKGLSSKRPALLFLASLLLRSAVVLAGFYFVGGNSWEKLAACLAGFLIARAVITRLARRPAEERAGTEMA